ncbi:nucleoside triphosphate pyrophosphatase [Methylomonas sp. AM2-LC]|uniref:Maf family protein n=1 Tax=Methylomonas sp. AM2-LC TaxID=3153301 RepID=UPI003262F8A7
MPAIILASSSPYRAALLRKLQLDFEICASHVDETPLPGESAQHLALRLSKAKANALSVTYPEHLIIGSDQVAVCGEQFLNKPGNREQAILQLLTQSGKSAQFYTGICVLDTASNKMHSAIDSCIVHFKTLTQKQIERYIDLEQPFDCAGSFKSENLGIALFSSIETSDPNTLVGLPLIKLISLLSEAGVEVI